MKKLATLILFLICSLSYSQVYTVVHINASWNSAHDLNLPNEIAGAKVVKADLDEQSKSLKSQITAVPVVMLFRGDKTAKVWRAGISLKLNLTKEEIENAINEDKQAYKSARSN